MCVCALPFPIFTRVLFCHYAFCSQNSHTLRGRGRESRPSNQSFCKSKVSVKNDGTHNNEMGIRATTKLACKCVCVRENER